MIRLTETHWRLVRFIVSGGTAALVLFVFSWLFLHLHWRPFVANLAAYAIAFVYGYSVQRAWTFKASHSHGHALPRYFIVQVCCALMTALVGEVGVTLLHLAPVATSAISTLLSAAVSYFATSLWVFPMKDAQKPSV